MFGIELKSDNFLVNEIKGGNEKALLILYKQNFNAVKKFVLNNNGTQDEVKDVMNETLITVWLTVAKADYLLNVKLSDFILSTAKNQWYKQIKRKNKFKIVDVTQTEINKQMESLPLKYDPVIVKNFVNRLDESSQKILMNYYDGLDINSMAEQMGFNTVDELKDKKYQCFKKLESLIREHPKSTVI